MAAQGVPRYLLRYNRRDEPDGTTSWSDINLLALAGWGGVLGAGLAALIWGACVTRGSVRVALIAGATLLGFYMVIVVLMMTTAMRIVRRAMKAR